MLDLFGHFPLRGTLILPFHHTDATTSHQAGWKYVTQHIKMEPAVSFTKLCNAPYDQLTRLKSHILYLIYFKDLM